MRNKYPGICYRCGLLVNVGDGHFERYNHSFRVIHAECVLKQRQEKAENKEKTYGKQICPQCDGTGIVSIPTFDDDECTGCEGTGRID